MGSMYFSVLLAKGIIFKFFVKKMLKFSNSCLETYNFSDIDCEENLNSEIEMANANSLLNLI